MNNPSRIYGDQEPELYVYESEVRKQLREMSPKVFALSRTTFPKEPPTGRKLELIKQQMLRAGASRFRPFVLWQFAAVAEGERCPSMEH